MIYLARRLSSFIFPLDSSFLAQKKARPPSHPIADSADGPYSELKNFNQEEK
jgi:hypothetical protein